MLHALEQIRRMRGGAQAHLMRCSDGNYYVVKFQNNPQHRRILVNELLGTRLAARLNLPTARVEIVEVGEELISLTYDLAMEMPRSRVPCHAGLQFGSLYPGDPRRLTLHDFLPDEQLRADLIFKVPDLTAQRRLGGMQPPRRRHSKAALLGDGDEIAKMPQLHASPHACGVCHPSYKVFLMRAMSAQLSVM